MLIINKMKPFYINENKKIIRMGNFEDTGKEIYFEDEAIKKLFELLKKPREKKEIIQVLNNNFNIPKKDIYTSLKYLKKEGFIIEYEKYNDLLISKYSRQDLFFNLFSCDLKYDSQNLNNKKILILGLGSVGSNAAVVLSRSGFKNITVVDFDKVEESNLNRQYFFNKNDINEYKSKCMKKILFLPNENVLNKFIERKEDIEIEIKKSDFVLCTLDKPERFIRSLINKLAIEYNKPVLFCGFTEHYGMVGPFVVPNETACLSCIKKDLDDIPLNNIDVMPSYGPLTLIVTGIVCNEIINYFVAFNKNNLRGKTLMYNIKTNEIQIVKFKKNKLCEVCNK